MSRKYVMKSIFAFDMERFLAHKRALGCKYRSGEQTLGRFDCFCVEHGISENLLSREVVEKWGTKQDHEHQKSYNNRLTVLRQFAMFLEKEGKQAYVLPPLIRVTPSPFVPYIFTRPEMMSIFHAVDHARKPPSYSPLVLLILPMLYRLMYSCGLRVSEACNLKKQEVDSHDGVLTISGAKGDKDRLVPMTLAISNRLNAYLGKMAFICPKTEYVFPNRSGERIAETTIYARFRKALFDAGIPHGGRGKGPRLHDLRHTFSVHSLEKMANEGMDLYCALPILSAYLGHTDVTSTEKYLRLTEEVYGDVLKRLVAAYGDMLPVVGEEAIW